LVAANIAAPIAVPTPIYDPVFLNFLDFSSNFSLQNNKK
tara:strand:- start:77 stop:193 length:117 start_codon:yes stop_codon:yes gene_type:complete